jgi:hypothetical protein
MLLVVGGVVHQGMRSGQPHSRKGNSHVDAHW